MLFTGGIGLQAVEPQGLGLDIFREESVSTEVGASFDTEGRKRGERRGILVTAKSAQHQRAGQFCPTLSKH